MWRQAFWLSAAGGLRDETLNRQKDDCARSTSPSSAPEFPAAAVARLPLLGRGARCAAFANHFAIANEYSMTTSATAQCIVRVVAEAIDQARR